MLRPTERLQIIDEISKKLQEKYTFTDIDIFLKAFKIFTPDDPYPGSKKIYVKSLIGLEDDDTLYKIAEELEITGNFTRPAGIDPPRNWQNVTDLKLFISHISKDKDKATRLRDCLFAYGINSFVAHEDIHPTLEWQIEIERALNTMDAFISIHTKGYVNSFWSQQEFGYAYGRGIKMLALRWDEDPTGFISKHQAIIRGKKTAEIVSEDIFNILNQDKRTNKKIKPPKKYDLDDIPF